MIKEKSLSLIFLHALVILALAISSCDRTDHLITSNVSRQTPHGVIVVSDLIDSSGKIIGRIESIEQIAVGWDLADCNKRKGVALVDQERVEVEFKDFDLLRVTKSGDRIEIEKVLEDPTKFSTQTKTE